MYAECLLTHTVEVKQTHLEQSFASTMLIVMWIQMCLLWSLFVECYLHRVYMLNVYRNGKIIPVLSQAVNQQCLKVHVHVDTNVLIVVIVCRILSSQSLWYMICNISTFIPRDSIVY